MSSARRGGWMRGRVLASSPPHHYGIASFATMGNALGRKRRCSAARRWSVDLRFAVLFSGRRSLLWLRVC